MSARVPFRYSYPKKCADVKFEGAIKTLGCVVRTCPRYNVKGLINIVRDERMHDV